MARWRACAHSSLRQQIDSLGVVVHEHAGFVRFARFFAVADLLGQRRIHVVMLGFNYFGVSIAAQILRSEQTADLGVARITILSSDPSGARDLLLLSYPGIEIVAEIAYVAADPRVVAIDVPLMSEIEAAAPITAIIVLGGLSADTLPTALAVHRLPAAPVDGWRQSFSVRSRPHT
jgi:hypothetical protein